jgi:N-acetylneuraminic acid mutarotase
MLKMEFTPLILVRLLSFNQENKTWDTQETFGEIPCPRCGHSATVYEDFMYIFGGIGSNLSLDDNMFQLDFSFDKFF